jgi:uncharacterized small protein (DUF1192 family)
LSDISGKVEGSGAGSVSSALVKELEQRMAQLAQQVEKVSGGAMTKSSSRFLKPASASLPNALIRSAILPSP